MGSSFWVRPRQQVDEELELRKLRHAVEQVVHRLERVGDDRHQWILDVLRSGLEKSSSDQPSGR